MKADNTCYTAAQDYAARGWFVFPNPPGTKASYLGKDKDPDHRNWGMTKDPERIKKYWGKWPRANVAIPTGSDNGIWILDLDTIAGHGKDGIGNLRALEAKYGKLPETRMVETPSGGLHYYWLLPNGVIIQGSDNMLRPGIDVQAEGDMVIAPPSVRPPSKGGGSYRCLNEGTAIIHAPEWLLQLIEEARTKRDNDPDESELDPELLAAIEQDIGKGTSTKPEDNTEYRSRTQEEKEAAIDAMHNPDLPWKFGWFTRMAAIFQLSNGSEWGLRAAHRFSAISRKYNKKNTDKTWRGLRKCPTNRISAGTVFHFANKDTPGWDERFKGKWKQGDQGPGSPDDGGHHAKQQQGQRQQEDEKLESAPASSYKMKAIRWLWKNRFALGKIGLLVGLPERAKSLIVAYMAAIVTTSGNWPCKEGRSPQGRVLLLTAEDDIEDTVIPRLIAANANIEMVEIVKMVKDKNNKRRMWSIASDLPLLQRKLEQFKDVVMVIIDPMSAYFGVGKVDSYRTSDVRAVLAPLKDLAEEKQISILGVLHFNKKVDITNALLRISDSLAFGAAARHCFAAIDDTENKRRLLVRVKNNLAAEVNALSYTIDVVTVGKDADTGDIIGAPYVKWNEEHVEITTTEAMELEGGKQGRPSNPRNKAKVLLKKMLANGPVPEKTIEEAEQENDISHRTMMRAKKDLNIESIWDKQNKQWVWYPPGDKGPVEAEPEMPF
jgi:bifunctional DNA primase/polymerase-like protein/AAA domain-containing protein/primase-like protein